ncbi:MAG: hypothetical protein ABI605_05085 [Rhizobacter sp.]
MRGSSRLFLALATGSALLFCTAAQAGDVKAKPAAGNQAQATAKKSTTAKATECPDASGQKAESNNPTGNKGDGSNNPGAKKPNPPKCPEKMAKKVATPQ